MALYAGATVPTGDALFHVHWQPDVATVFARKVFYNNSYWDGNDPLPGPSDDLAIATGKQALLPGEPATSANYTSYWGGINGIMIDVKDLADPAGLKVATVGDYFGFKVGTSGDPGTWAAARAPTYVDVRVGEGDGGSDRVTIIWKDGAIRQIWLQVTVKASDATGLVQDDVFYYANLPGDADSNGTVDLDDFVLLKSNFGTGGLATDEGDFDLDDDVDLDDFVTLKCYFGVSLKPPVPTTGLAGTVDLLTVASEPADAIPSPGPHALGRVRPDRRRPRRRRRGGETAAPALDVLAASRLNVLSR